MNIKAYLKNPYRVFYRFNYSQISRLLSDEALLKLIYRARMGVKLDLNNPKTFNEKVQYLKLYNRKPEYTVMADKAAVKNYVADIIGEKHIIPTLGVWERFDDINFDSLPERFVLKCTHDTGSIIIVKDKSTINKNELKRYYNKKLLNNLYYRNREWPYKNIKPQIIAEKYMEDLGTKELRDYKFYCFDGYVKALLVATNRQSKTEELCFDYFDRDYKHLELTNHWHPNAKTPPAKPTEFHMMLEFAELLSKGIPHVRIDFYEVNGEVYFGEFTFSDAGGYLMIEPKEWELEWGNLIKLPSTNC